MIVVMAGLPGSGKSTLARAIATRLGGVVLSKDELRAATFPDAVLDYTPEQDDLVMEMVYQAASYIQRSFPNKPVIIDGRTFSKRAQVQRLLDWAASSGATTKWIECVCDDETARKRLQHEQKAAGNRDFQLYETLKREAEALEVKSLQVDTANTPVDSAVDAVVQYLKDDLLP